MLLTTSVFLKTDVKCHLPQHFLTSVFKKTDVVSNISHQFF